MAIIEAFVGRWRKSGWLLLCSKIEGLVMESFCDAPHSVQFVVVTFQPPSKVALEGMIPYNHAVIPKLVVSGTQACCDSSP